MGHAYRSSSAPTSIKRFVPRRLLRYRLVLLLVRNLLRDQGMYRSILRARPTRADGEPVPWFTLPATAYLDQLDFSDRRVFEFGSGFSTLYWQHRAASVTSVEDDEEWYAEMKDRLDPDRVTYLHVIDPERYVGAIETGTYDVVVIDGSWREQCVAPALAHLSPRGVLIFDNADWYPEQAAQIRGAGLLEVDFTGVAPGNAYTSTTSMFFRPGAAIEPLSVQPVVGAGGMPENVRVTGQHTAHP